MSGVPSLDVVIVNWNAGEMLYRCVQSLKAFGGAPIQIIVVDNASTDNSMDAIEESFSDVISIRNTVNTGFAAACNQGARKGKADYVLFLNPDAEVTAGTLITTLRFMESSEGSQVGICGVSLRDETRHVVASCFSFPTVRRILNKLLGLNRVSSIWFEECLMERMDYTVGRVVDQVIGAYFLVRRSLYASLDGFDERFFVYFEEVDFSYRAFLLGWHSYYLASTEAYHVGGGCSDKARAHRIFYSSRSRILYGDKHFTRFGAAVVKFSTLVIEPVTRISFAAARGRFTDVQEVWRGFAMLYRDMAKRR